MNYTILASGSRGNATLIQDGSHIIMVDCGLPKGEMADKLAQLGVRKSQIEAILVTHEHIDHIRDLGEFPIEILWGTKGTYNFVCQHILVPYQEYEVAGFKVMPLSTSHDCKNPCGYLIKTKDETMVYVTDTGYVKEDDYKYLQNATHYIFESNYDDEMLLSSGRPFYLKQRIKGMQGHLSNESSANILAQIIGPSTKSIRLAHVSEDCNTKKLAYDALINTFEELGIIYQGIDIVVADRYDITEGVKKHEKH